MNSGPLSEQEKARRTIAIALGWPAFTVHWRGSCEHDMVEFFIEGGGATQWKRNMSLFRIKEPISHEKVVEAITAYKVLERLLS